MDFPLGKYCTMDLGAGPGAWLRSNTASMTPTRTHPHPPPLPGQHVLPKQPCSAPGPSSAARSSSVTLRNRGKGPCPGNSPCMLMVPREGRGKAQMPTSFSSCKAVLEIARERKSEGEETHTHAPFISSSGPRSEALSASVRDHVSPLEMPAGSSCQLCWCPGLHFLPLAQGYPGCRGILCPQSLGISLLLPTSPTLALL